MARIAQEKRSGMSKVAQREERLAFLMLVPSFLVILVIAIYPLFTVIRDGFTDRMFASDRPVEFIGLDNYATLLSVTIAELPPVIDPETGRQKLNQDGEPVYESAVQVLPRKPRRYKEVNQFDLLGRRYVIGATDDEFVQATFDTVLFTVFTVALETILGLGIALVVNSKFKGRGLMRATMLVPWAIPTVVSAKIWQWMFQPTRAGLFNATLNAVGIGDGQMAFLREANLQLPAIIAVDVWKTTPFMALLLLAGLQLIPEDLYEAAKVDGAGKVRRFLSITLPLLRPTLAVALIFRTLDALRVFDVFSVLLARTRYSMASYTQDQLIGNQAAGLSSAASIVIFVLIFLFALAYIRTLGVQSS